MCGCHGARRFALAGGAKQQAPGVLMVSGHTADAFRARLGKGFLALLVLGSWVGVWRLFHHSLFLSASRVVLPQDPSTRQSHLGVGGEHVTAERGRHHGGQGLRREAIGAN